MRIILTLLLLTCINAYALTPQEQELVQQIRAQVKQAQDSLWVSNAALKTVSDALRVERERLDDASKENMRLSEALDTARSEQGALQESLRSTEAQLAKLKPKAEAYDRLRFVIAFITTLLSGALVYACIPLLPLQYRILASIAVGAVAGGLVYVIVSQL